MAFPFFTDPNFTASPTTVISAIWPSVTSLPLDHLLFEPYL